MDSSAIMINHAHDVNTGNFYDGYLCRNCLDYVEMAESYENSHDLPDSYFKTVDSQLQQFEVFIGHLHGNKFDNRCWHKDMPDNNGLCNSEECCTESSFFNYCYTGCFLCSEQIGGDYWDCTAIKKVTV